MQTYQTTDIAIAAYLKIKGFRLIDAGLRKGQKGAHFYSFNDPDGQAHAMAVEFANSPEATYDAAHRALKKLVYSTRSQERSEMRSRGGRG